MKYRTIARFIAEGVEGIGVTLIVMSTWPLSRRWLRNWGAHPGERDRVWPGDKFVSRDHTAYTRAIDVAVSGDAVWPWLVQFGLGRAGFYSYELLERVLGIPVRNVESIMSDLPRLSVGDEILLHPKAPGIPVAALKEGRYICFGTVEGPDSPIERPDPARSWSMYIESLAGNSSRLLLRGCIESLREPTFSKRLTNLLEEPIDFIMEQRMLRTIKRLAEAEPSATISRD
jgi:hypothetical protein